MILVSACTDPSAPVPRLAAEHQSIARRIRWWYSGNKLIILWLIIIIIISYSGKRLINQWNADWRRFWRWGNLASGRRGAPPWWPGWWTWRRARWLQPEMYLDQKIIDVDHMNKIMVKMIMIFMRIMLVIITKTMMVIMLIATCWYSCSNGLQSESVWKPSSESSANKIYIPDQRHIHPGLMRGNL